MTRTPLALVLALLAGPALADGMAVMEKDGVLTDANGMTLYTLSLIHISEPTRPY